MSDRWAYDYEDGADPPYWHVYNFDSDRVFTFHRRTPRRIVLAFVWILNRGWPGRPQ